ncbi:hypothetical protein Caci_0080 [Catenulispora acidiphila DSM 44928]|uniref:Uncharacterized protein n=1 Tax=Catenulispora acidiphila (strain DSM 44928 / JCM 14897 / NBRC 102108 / NRRL B-24433 / ID139908) TaxID=479433 RepID=C7QH96_CATAD|nr:hypothetical protein [Catenulispora acidiphila]ACU69035.1 hypothetical protein Caci_0080 [Catenulispora acidiphila DSM 44928]
MRNLLGSLLAIIGAAATLVSPWQAWYNNRHGSSYKFYEVFGSGVTLSGSGIMDSVFLVFLITAVLAVAGVVLRSRALVGAAGVIAFGFTILWMVRQGQAAGELTVTGANNRGLGSGVAYAFGGGLLMIIGSLMMTGRTRRTVVAEPARTKTADQAMYGTAATTSAPPAITTTAPADKNPVPPAAAPAATPAQTSASAAPTASERTGTERLSKEERQMLGLDEDASAEPKKQN